MLSQIFIHCIFTGVLWVGDSVIGRANEAINKLRALGKKVFYVTNNSSRSRDEYVAKFEKLGFIASKVICCIVHRVI